MSLYYDQSDGKPLDEAINKEGYYLEKLISILQN